MQVNDPSVMRLEIAIEPMSIFKPTVDKPSQLSSRRLRNISMRRNNAASMFPRSRWHCSESTPRHSV